MESGAAQGWAEQSQATRMLQENSSWGFWESWVGGCGVGLYKQLKEVKSLSDSFTYQRDLPAGLSWLLNKDLQVPGFPNSEPTLTP